jgi:hypothetical protein
MIAEQLDTLYALLLSQIRPMLSDIKVLTAKHCASDVNYLWRHALCLQRCPVNPEKAVKAVLYVKPVHYYGHTEKLRDSVGVPDRGLYRIPVWNDFAQNGRLWVDASSTKACVQCADQREICVNFSRPVISITRIVE